MSDVSVLEKFFKAQIAGVAEATACFGAKLSNTFPQATANFPRATFQVIPLDDTFGQARTSIQSKFLIDFKIYSKMPLPETVDAAIDAVKEHFRTAEKSFYYQSYAISIRHERPISQPAKGLKPDEQIIMRGSTYRVWMAKA
jgi:hypothetical protein